MAKSKLKFKTGDKVEIVSVTRFSVPKYLLGQVGIVEVDKKEKDPTCLPYKVLEFWMDEVNIKLTKKKLSKI